MQHRFIKAAAIAAVLTLAATVTVAADGTPEAAKPATKSSTPEKAAKAKAAKPKPPRLVNINGATKSQLTKLPGIDDALAAKIIAGRPYHSKADLVTREIIPQGTYEGLKRQIVAKQK